MISLIIALVSFAAMLYGVALMGDSGPILPGLPIAIISAAVMLTALFIGVEQQSRPKKEAKKRHGQR